MKLLLGVLLFSTMCAASLQAGGFGGPGPFRNDSPLSSGIDGVYQAAARAPNATGLIRFGIENGFQSGSRALNQWIFFVNGSIFRGSTAVVIVESTITGVLDSDDLELPVDEDGSIALPAAFVVRGTRAAGQFSGELEQQNPNGLFYGDGTLIPAPEEEIQIITIIDPTEDAFIIDGDQPDPVTVTPVELGGGVGEDIDFEFRGVRASTAIAGTVTEFEQEE